MDPRVSFSPNFGLNDNSIGVIYRFTVSYEVQQLFGHFSHGEHDDFASEVMDCAVLILCGGMRRRRRMGGPCFRGGPRKVNPYADQAGDRRRSQTVRRSLCEVSWRRCSGPQRKGPVCVTPEVQQAADGEIFWLLRNGALRSGHAFVEFVARTFTLANHRVCKSLGEAPAT